MTGILFTCYCGNTLGLGGIYTDATGWHLWFGWIQYALQSAGSLLWCQEYRRTDRYSQKWLCTLLITNHSWLSEIGDNNIFYFFYSVYYSAIVAAYYYSFSAFFPSHFSLFWVILNVQWRHVSIGHSVSLKIRDVQVWQPFHGTGFGTCGWGKCTEADILCQPQTWSHQDSQALGILDSHLSFAAAPPGFQPGLVAWRNSLSHFSSHSVKLWSALRNIKRTGPFEVYY